MAQTSRPPTPNKPPPYAEETADSRIGLQTGLLGATNVTRTWRVYCSSSTVNPVQTITNLSSKHGGVKTGEAFPKSGGWGDGTYVLLYFTIVDHWIGTNVWILQGHYVPSYFAGYATQLWEFNIRGSLQSERVYTTFASEGNPSKGIGIPRYEPIGDVSPSDGRAVFTATVPGRPIERLVLPPGFSDPTAATLPRFMDGADAPKRISTVSLWTIIPTWRYEAVAAAMNDKGYTNVGNVFAETTSGPITWVDSSDNNRNTIIISEISLDPVPPAQNSAPSVGTGPAFRVGITLQFNPDGWQTTKRHTYKSDSGYEAFIYDSGGRVIDEEFMVVGETSITAILASFL